MSEYQYYEFRAIDRPLTEKEIRELRSYSTRAVITPTSFVNHYEWGNFKGDEDAWVEKYFEAFVYVANWGTHILKLRFPSEVVEIATARQYCVSDAAMARQVKGNVIITMTSEDEEGYWGGKYLDSLVGREPELWAEVDRLVATTKPKHYDEALTILVNLRDLASRKNEESGFKQRIQALRHANTRKPSFLDRLAKADVPAR
jgi:hypothetical protein